MKFSTLKFGEHCPKHPQPAPRGLDNAGVFKGPPKAESAMVARNRASGDWAKWDPQPAQPRPNTAGASATSPSVTARPPVSASSVPVSTTADLISVPSRAPPRTRPTPEEEKALVRGNTPVYLEEPRPRPVSAAGLAGRATASSSRGVPNATNPEAADATYDAERVVDAFITRVAQRALEKSNFNPSPQVQARALQQELQKFGKGSGVTRGTMEAAFTFMATSLRPRALDALWMRINPHGADSVTFQQVAKLCVGIDVPPRARPEVRVKLETIRQKLQQRYPPGQGVAALRRGFAVIDRDRSGSLNAKELVQFLEKLGLRLTPYDADVLIAAFDRNGDGAVSLQEFCRAVRGPMSSTRAALVTQAFKQIDADGSGSLTLPELTERYDASKHPEVIAGRQTAEQVVADFVAPWDTRVNVADATGESRSGDGVVTLAEFLDYYDDTSATIDDDEYFELMIRNCWHLSGGEGAAQNTSCKRVLVEFKDGTQRVVEITNDLGLKFDDVQAVRRRLEQQGVKDIAVVKLK